MRKRLGGVGDLWLLNITAPSLIGARAETRNLIPETCGAFQPAASATGFGDQVLCLRIVPDQYRER
jgi:hypothetical protein